MSAPVRPLRTAPSPYQTQGAQQLDLLARAMSREGDRNQRSRMLGGMLQLIRDLDKAAIVGVEYGPIIEDLIESGVTSVVVGGELTLPEEAE